MTMAAMVDRLVEMGFDVEKVYDKFDKGYRFTISKGDHHTSCLFVYPSDTSAAFCDAKQREFIDFIINKWRNDHMSARRNGKYPLSSDMVREIFEHAEKAGVLKPTISKIPEITQKDIERVTRQILDTDPLIQLKIYDAISKGENNMPTETERYVRHDINSLAAAFKRVNDAFNKKLPGIKTVHFSGPVTAVIWEDKTKTIVRCKDGDVPDYEKGLAMAIAKRALGTNKSGSNYYDVFKKWLPKDEEPVEPLEEK